jgi:endonuclease YncB( thermonuclease family)
MEERPRIVFDNLPDVFIEQVIPSPDWENFLVVYSVNSYGQHSPANEIMLFNMDNGVMWHMASDDMPFMNGRQYGWVNNDTVYIYGQEGTNPPQRIYGIDYTASGVPQCLVDRFPESTQKWVDLWERGMYARLQQKQLLM